MTTPHSQSGGSSSLVTPPPPPIGGGISALHPSAPPPVGGEGGGGGINKMCLLSHSSHPVLNTSNNTAINNAVHSSTTTASTSAMQISSNTTSSSSISSIHLSSIPQHPPPPITSSMITSQHLHHLNAQNTSNVNASSASMSTCSLPMIQQSNISEANAALPSSSTSLQQFEKEKIYQLVMELGQSNKREIALLELSKRRETFPDLAPVLWYSFGTIAALLQEIVSIYPLLSPPSLIASSSNRVCNSLALLQCVASHPETRQLFLNAHIPLFLYPFLNTVSKSRPFEYLRLTSLGVIGALVKVDDPDVINFLLQTEIIPLCLRIMETGSELSKTVATFIVQKILLDELGLNYICATAERFYAVSTVLSNMVNSLIEIQSARLLKHIIRCYLRLTDNCRAREALRQCLPEALKDQTFHACLKDDNGTKRWLLQLLSNISDNSNVHVSHNTNQNINLQQKQQQALNR